MGVFRNNMLFGSPYLCNTVWMERIPGPFPISTLDPMLQSTPSGLFIDPYMPLSCVVHDIPTVSTIMRPLSRSGVQVRDGRGCLFYYCLLYIIGTAVLGFH